jgi:hypothetical protein
VPAPADTIAPAVSLAVPRQRLGAVLRRGLRVSLRSSERASTTLRLSIDGRTAKRLGLTRTAKPIVVGHASVSFAAAGGKTVYVRLGRTAKARIARLASVTLTVRASARDLAGNVRQASRRATVRR